MTAEKLHSIFITNNHAIHVLYNTYYVAIPYDYTINYNYSTDYWYKNCKTKAHNHFQIIQFCKSNLRRQMTFFNNTEAFPYEF